MQIAQTVQIPNTQMFVNGVMDQAWYMFFYSLSQNASKGDEIDTTELLQLASQLPVVTVNNNILDDVDDLLREFNNSPIQHFEEIQPMPVASVFCFEDMSTFPLTNVGCHEPSEAFHLIQITSDMQGLINGNN